MQYKINSQLQMPLVIHKLKIGLNPQFTASPCFNATVNSMSQIIFWLTVFANVVTCSSTAQLLETFVGTSFPKIMKMANRFKLTKKQRGEETVNTA